MVAGATTFPLAKPGALRVLGSCGNGDYDSNGYNGVCRRQAAHILIAEGDTTTLLTLSTLPADWYLSPIVSNAACTEILRLRLRMTVPGGKSRNADFILIAKGDTTTLSRKVAVKLQNLKNLRGGAPSTFLSEPGSPRGLYHSSSPQGSSEILSRRMYTFSVSYSICSDQRVTARMRSWVRAHSRRMKVTLSRL